MSGCHSQPHVGGWVTVKDHSVAVVEQTQTLAREIFRHRCGRSVGAEAIVVDVARVPVDVGGTLPGIFREQLVDERLQSPHTGINTGMSAILYYPVFHLFHVRYNSDLKVLSPDLNLELSVTHTWSML